MPIPLLDVLGTYLDAILLAAQAWVVGGTAFAALVAAPLGEQRILRRALRWLSAGGIGLVGAEVLSLVPPLGEIMEQVGLDFANALGADFVLWHAVAMLAGLAVAILAALPIAARRPRLLLVPVAVILVAGTMTSHAASRLDGRIALGAFHLIHVTAASAWVGGIPYLLMALSTPREPGVAGVLVRRFSALAAASVGLLAVTALALARVHVATFAGLIGSEYGGLLLAKAALFGCMLLLGLGNFQVGRGMAANSPKVPVRLRGFAEAEIGLAAAVLMIAASLAGQAPPVDLPNELVAPGELWQRLSPTAWPRLWDPPPGQRTGITWSEVNHNLSGVFVCAIGLGALFHRTGWCGWARHWPLLFITLTVTLMRSDPETWPLGSCSVLGCGGADPEVIQHRLLLLLPLGFGMTEWMVRTGRLKLPWAVYLFPLFCAVGGALLLAHNHQIEDVRSRYLVQVSHIPMGALAILAGCAQWVELSADERARRIAGWIWPICILLIGLLLVIYRES